MSLPRVTVVVGAYNAEEHIRESLASILAQEGVDLELIVVDDGSTDRSAEAAVSMGARVVRLEHSGTPSVPRNHGAALAKGDFIGFFDADDVMLPGALRRLTSTLVEHSDSVVAVCDYVNFGPDGTAASHFSTCDRLREVASLDPEGPATVLEGLAARSILTTENFTITGGLLFPMQWWRHSGGFDTSLRGSVDYDLAYRAALTGSMAVAGFVGFRRRIHPGNISRQALRALRHKAISREKLSRVEPDPVLAKVLRLRASRYYRTLAGFARREHHPVVAASATINWLRLAW